MNIRKWLISIVLIVVFGAATFVVHRIYLDRLDEYRESNFDEFSFQVHSVLESHKKFSEYLQSTLVDNEYVLSLIYEANDATEERQSELRQELYDYLIDDYNLISEYDFKQMHFHFSDNTSFLRMHEPDKYGDNLEQSRYSVWLTNETYRPSVGFEEGKIFNAYRYVYPLSYNNEHIGSIEISVSVSSVINGLTELYDDYDYGMIMSKDIINNKVFEDKLEYYQPSTISDAFCEDKTVIDATEKRNNLETYQLQDLLSSLEIENLENEYIPRFELLNYEDVRYEVLVLPIKNIENIGVGYFYSVTDHNGYMEIRNALIFNLLIVIGASIGLTILVFMVDGRRELMKKISETDQLTKIYNRRKFDEVLHYEYERARRYGTTFSLVMFDLDHFKKVNDQFGHQIGDTVLVELCDLIKKQLRFTDTFARFGGEEFIIVLPETPLLKALQKANQLSGSVEDNEFSVVRNITISLGVSSFKPGMNEKEILRKADEALYKAKNSGRNRVVTTMEM